MRRYEVPPLVLRAMKKLGSHIAVCLVVLWAWSCGAVLCHSQLLMLLFFLLQKDNKNYLTLVEKYGDGMLVCGTGACAPTCWNLVCCCHL